MTDPERRSDESEAGYVAPETVSVESPEAAQQEQPAQVESETETERLRQRVKDLEQFAAELLQSMDNTVTALNAAEFEAQSLRSAASEEHNQLALKADTLLGGQTRKKIEDISLRMSLGKERF
jgi:hypothetical protein